MFEFGYFTMLIIGSLDKTMGGYPVPALLLKEVFMTATLKVKVRLAAAC